MANSLEMSLLKLRVDSSVVVRTIWLVKLIEVASTSTEEVTVLPLGESEVLRASKPMVLSEGTSWAIVVMSEVETPMNLVDKDEDSVAPLST